jgi:hypothetical protein
MEAVGLLQMATRTPFPGAETEKDLAAKAGRGRMGARRR